MEGSSAHLIEDCDEGLLSGEAAEEVIDLHEDGGEDDPSSCVPSIRAAQALSSEFSVTAAASLSSSVTALG